MFLKLFYPVLSFAKALEYFIYFKRILKYFKKYFFLLRFKQVKTPLKTVEKYIKKTFHPI